MYEDPNAKPGFSHGLHPYYFCLNGMLRKTIAPKDGYSSNVVALSRNVLARFSPEGTQFSIMGFIVDEIIKASIDTRKSLPYAPYIMNMIEKEINLVFVK